MDFSKEYIAMCVEAEELQENYKPAIGDYAVRNCEYENYRVGIIAWRYDQGRLWWMTLDGYDGITLHPDNSQEHYLEKLIWLPRQDQIQEIITPDIMSKYVKYTTFDTSLYWNRITALTKWVDTLGCNKNFYANKLIELECEPLWICFAMWEKHNKVWDGNNWKLLERN